VAIKKNTVRIVQTIFFRIFLCKSGHILRKKGHMSPYLDNELLLVARTRQDYKKILPDYLHSAIASPALILVMPLTLGFTLHKTGKKRTCL
jgi:hypothetical protein